MAVAFTVIFRVIGPIEGEVQETTRGLDSQNYTVTTLTRDKTKICCCTAEKQPPISKVDAYSLGKWPIMADVNDFKDVSHKKIQGPHRKWHYEYKLLQRSQIVLRNVDKPAKSNSHHFYLFVVFLIALDIFNDSVDESWKWWIHPGFR